jgi:hypothetical protein
MVKQKKGAEYNKDALIDLLGLQNVEDPIKLKRGVLAKEAFHRGLISLKDCIDANGGSVTTLKRYLYTLVEDEPTREAIDTYVIWYSSIYSVASKVINAFLCYCWENKLLNDPTFIKDVLLDQTQVKYMVLPFKQELTGAKNSKGAHPVFQQFWEAYKEIFLPMYPPKVDLIRMKWDQTICKMAGNLITAFESHVTIHFGSRFRAYTIYKFKERFQLKPVSKVVDGVKRNAFQRRTDETLIFVKDVYGAIQKNDPIPGYPEETLWLQTFRKACGVPETKDFDDYIKDLKVTPEVLSAHIKMSLEFEDALVKEEALLASLDDMKAKAAIERCGLKRFSISPVTRTKRCFAYIDQRILDHLKETFKIKSDLTLQETFKLEKSLWNKANKQARKKLRNNQKSRKKKRNYGLGSFPSNAIATSILTDGVALCVNISTVAPPSAPVEDGCKEKEPVIIAFDEGRVNLFQSAQKDSNGRFVTTRLTADHYQKKALVRRFTEWEKQDRVNNPELQKAITKLSKCTWKTSRLEQFLKTCRTLSDEYEVFYRHSIVSKERAQHQMVMWRRKLAIMAQRYSHTFAKVLGKDRSKELILAVGDAKIKSTGKKGKEKERHGGVPTSGKQKVMMRVLRSNGYRGRLVPIDEYNTTQCCHHCGNKQKDVFDSEGQVIRGLKKCMQCCTPETSFKTRNRDFNAAINIWKIALSILNNEDRPSYLCRPKKPKKVEKPKVDCSDKSTCC